VLLLHSFILSDLKTGSLDQVQCRRAFLNLSFEVFTSQWIHPRLARFRFVELKFITLHIYGVIWQQILCPRDVECSNVSYHSTVFFWVQYHGYRTFVSINLQIENAPNSLDTLTYFSVNQLKPWRQAYIFRFFFLTGYI
jgi:hypothetical protein